MDDDTRIVVSYAPGQIQLPQVELVTMWPEPLTQHPIDESKLENGRLYLIHHDQSSPQHETVELGSWTEFRQPDPHNRTGRFHIIYGDHDFIWPGHVLQVWDVTIRPIPYDT